MTYLALLTFSKKQKTITITIIMITIFVIIIIIGTSLCQVDNKYKIQLLKLCINDNNKCIYHQLVLLTKISETRED